MSEHQRFVSNVEVDLVAANEVQLRRIIGDVAKFEADATAIENGFVVELARQEDGATVTIDEGTQRQYQVVGDEAFVVRDDAPELIDPKIPESSPIFTDLERALSFLDVITHPGREV